MRFGLSSLLAATAAASAFAAVTKPKVILMVLVDDLGWGDVNFNRINPITGGSAPADPEIITPTMDQLAADGIHLTRHYVYRYCTPTRSSMISGRFPVHVQTSLANPEDPDCGVPRNMTGIGWKLKQGGYYTAWVGKQDTGMATPHHTPEGRGFDESLIYFEHKNDFWTQQLMQSSCQKYGTFVDLWDTGKPASGLNGTAYEEFMFRDRILDIINRHDFTQNLFLLYTPHVAHCPLQVPKENLDRFDFMENDDNECSAQTPYIFPGSTASDYKCRQQYHAMVNVLDDNLNNITGLLKSKGVWEDTLMVLSSDNGGPEVLAESGANNYPLRGSKYSEFEGGFRAAAFVSGGWLPTEVQGTTTNEMMHVADWYTTFSTLVGVDPADPWAKASNLPPVDGLDVTALITTRGATSPHTAIPVTTNSYIKGNYKLVTGGEADFASWSGPQFPNASSPASPVEGTKLDCTKPCLFDVVNDPTEHNELSASMPDKVAELLADFETAKASFFTNNDTGVMSCPANITMPCACWMASHKYGGFLGPYQEVTV